MAGRSGGLGKRGLDSVFGGAKEVATIAKGESSNELPLKDLIPNPYQPRKTFEPEKMKELENSVRQSGIIQPLIVRKSGKKYEIVAGERRWRAAKAVGLKKVPVVVRKYDDATMKEIALVENLQRSDLDPLEEARGIKAFMEDLNISQLEAAKRLGKSRTAVANALRLLNLPNNIQGYLSSGKLTPGLVRPLLSLDDTAAMERVAKMAAEGEWSVRVMEEFVNAEKEGKKPKITFTKTKVIFADDSKQKQTDEQKDSAQKDVHTLAFEEQLKDYLGTKVSINPNKNEASGGKIVIEYYGIDDLERLYELLQQKEALESGRKHKTSKFNI